MLFSSGQWSDAWFSSSDLCVQCLIHNCFSDFYPQASWVNEHSEVKRKKLEIKLESDDANDNFTFPETMSRRDKKGEETERFVLHCILSHKHSLHCCANLSGSIPFPCVALLLHRMVQCFKIKIHFL